MLKKIQKQHYLLFGWTSAYAGPVVLEQVFRAVLDTGGAVGVFARRVALPPVLGRVVDLHRRALLLAHALVVEVLARLRIEKFKILLHMFKLSYSAILSRTIRKLAQN